MIEEEIGLEPRPPLLLPLLLTLVLSQQKKERREIREGDIGADLRIDLKSFVEISDGSFPTSLRIHCHRSVNFFNNSLIRMLCYVVGFAKD